MSRSGGTSGKGGRSYRLNWTDVTDGASFGDWSVRLSSPGSAHPFKVYFKAEPVLHRRFFACFASVENAKRWVEKRIAAMGPALSKRTS
jgi:hypothetical protein